jgi:fermentation-respiration switch protein FrsA (DUF1100 family)
MVMLLAGGLIWYSPYYCYRTIIRRKNIRRKSSPVRRGEETDPEPWLDTREYRRVSLRSFDGLNLNAYHVAAGGGAVSGDTVILAHGYRGDGKQLGGYARIFWETLGCNALLPDARGYGHSGGDYTGFGWHERLDILGWINWVTAHTVSQAAGPGVPVRIILFGVSMGASTMIMASGENLPPEVKVVIADCGYTSLEDEVRYQMRRFYHIPAFFREPLLKAAGALTKKRAGYCFEEASAVNQVKKSRVPILFIHGDADTFVPVEMAHSLFEACPSEKELYLANGAGHGQARAVDPGEYERRIAGFVRKYMPGSPMERL